MGVLVHSGTAETGHYYAYVKRREYDARESGGKTPSGFFSFDDTRVETYDLRASLESDCFGGKGYHSQVRREMRIFCRKMRTFY